MQKQLVTPSKDIANLNYVDEVDRKRAVETYLTASNICDTYKIGKPPIATIHSTKNKCELRIYMYSSRGWKYYQIASYNLVDCNEIT